MNWDTVKSNWNKFKERLKARWGKLAGDHPGALAGPIGRGSDVHFAVTAGCIEKLRQRREVLRGALVMACGVLVPAVFYGCDSKTTSNAPAANSTPVPSATPAPEQQAPSSVTERTVPQESVRYQLQPRGGLQCDGCLNFVAESNTCKLVEGQISPTGWCILWIGKS
ncbi:MAG: hypothetical protein HYZ31_08180 [Gammaproteobacteria bacterium]|nr:hypothetical protein [Gammaproteobacteria bacterium]